MKVQKMGDPYGGISTASLQSNYQVPCLDGRMVQATPLKFCLKFRPPTIAVVYTIQGRSSKSKNRSKKYIHEITVDFASAAARSTTSYSYSNTDGKHDLDKLCEHLCERESMYLNTTVISKS